MRRTPGDAVPLASVVLWVPERRTRHWRVWTDRATLVAAVIVLAAWIDERFWLLIVAAGGAGLGYVAYRERTRREWLSDCVPSHLTVGEGYLELRRGTGPDTTVTRWALTEVRSVRFTGGPLGVGGTVRIEGPEPVSVRTGRPVERTKRGLKAVRAAALAQGVDLGTRKRASIASAETAGDEE